MAPMTQPLKGKVALVAEENWREATGAREYGFTNLDGSQPDCWRYMVEVQDAGLPRTRRATADQAAAGSGRTTTVSAIGMISSTGRSAREACSRIASALEAS